jgi:hypothetical protein
MPSSKAKESLAHHWKFYRAGGVDQVRIDTGADILHLSELDQKLWVALSCPVKGLELEERTLELLDQDHDGILRPPELLAAAKWLGEVLQNPDELVAGKDSVPLTSIRTDTEEGRRVKDAALHVTRSLGKEGAAVVTIEDATKTQAILAQAKANGDGVVPLAALADTRVSRLAEEVMACAGSVTDRSGAPGVDTAKLEQFLGDCRAFDGWWKLAEADAKDILPLGEETHRAAAAFETVRAKVDDYFGRCRLVAYDPRAQGALNRPEAIYLELGAEELSLVAQQAAELPLAAIVAGKPLPLSGAVNPSWAQALADFTTQCVVPLLGGTRAELADAEWSKLHEQLAAHRAWLQKKAGDPVATLGISRVREILRDDARAKLTQAVADDLAVGAIVANVIKVEKLVRLYRDFRRLLLNFVNFSEFYAHRGAIFQAGTLYLDGRACDLTVRVDDAGKHATLGAKSGTYLAYVDCTRPGCDRMQLAAAVTVGHSDNLFVGRNGVFYDRQGRDWCATVTKIIDNPISVRQAFWSPYKKVMRWIEDQIAKRAAASDAASMGALQGVATAAGTSATTGTAPAQKPKIDIGVVAALGVAVGGITAALGMLLNSFFGLGLWMPVGVVGALLLISGPSMLIAALKLRQRNLGPLLDANGWAVNTMTRINMPLGAALTTLATIPAGSSRSFVDPYAEKRRLWPRLLLLAVLIGLVGLALYRTGTLHTWWPEIPLPRSEAAATSAPIPAPTRSP